MGRRFSLQKVLDYRAHIKNDEAEAMNRVQAEYNAIQSRRDALLGTQASERARFQINCASGQTAGQIAATGTYLKDLSQQIDRSNAELAKQGERVEAQRKRLLAAAQDKEILEKLRARAEAEYQSAERKSEERYIQEFLINRAAHAKG
jgi:flagellar export protein FliJ